MCKKYFKGLATIPFCALTYSPSTKKCYVPNNKYMSNSSGPMNVRSLLQASKMSLVELQEYTMNVFRGDYKIHIQVQEEYLVDLLKDLIDAWKNKLQSDIWLIKYIAVGYDPVFERSMPVIVIYPYNGYDHAKRVLDTLLTIDPRIGLNIVPRFNEKINNLLYVAGGDSDKKFYYRDYDIFEKPDMTYYVGQKRLI